jgi:hypothetical protein
VDEELIRLAVFVAKDGDRGERLQDGAIATA